MFIILMIDSTVLAKRFPDINSGEDHQMSKAIFMDALSRRGASRLACGSATSVVTMDLMDKVGAAFPEAHLDVEKMSRLAEAGHTVLGFDNVMPLFSTWHEAAALGSHVDWGEKHRMPDCQGHLYESVGDDFRFPDDWLKSEPCQVPLKAIGLLKKRLGGDAAVLGKVFGPWTLGYHMCGVENFLMATLLEPDNVKRAMRRLLEITVAFANAQAEAGADALCLGDHCTRDLCSPESYREFLQEMHQELVSRVKCPLILHICGDSSDRIRHIAVTRVPCFHFDSKVPAATARALAGDKMALMGGTSNYKIVRLGTPETISNDVMEKVKAGVDILGPECAVPLDAPWRNLQMFSQAVKAFKK